MKYDITYRYGSPDLRDAFQNHRFSRSWEEFEHKYYQEGKCNDLDV